MKLLAVEPRQWGTYQIPRYEKAERLGHQVYLLAGEGGDPSTWPAERYRMLGSKRLPDLIQAARAWHAEEGFDAIFTFSEMAVIPVAHIARSLGLPGNDPQAALTSRNKLLMRQAHQRAGVPHPRFRFVRSADEALAAASDFGYPVIIKPTLGGASAFVFRVDTPDELRLRFQQSADGISDPKFYTYMEADEMELGPNGLLIESFLDGHEHLIEATVWDGEVFLGSVVDRVTVEGKVFDDDVHHAPTSLPQADYDKLYQVAAAGVRSQGLQRSVAHVEIRFHQGEPYVLEIAARPGGGGLDDMARAIGGHDPIRAVVDIARGLKPELHHWKPTGVHMSGVAMICPAGVVEEVIVPRDLPLRSDIGFFRIVVKPGDAIRRPPDGNTVFGYLGVTGTSFEDVFRKTNEYMAEIEVKLVGKSEAVGSAPV